MIYFLCLFSKESQVHQRISELRKEGQWSASRLPKLVDASRPKSHWDYLLEEMQWMAADFAQERRWKEAAAKKVWLDVCIENSCCSNATVISSIMLPLVYTLEELLNKRLNPKLLPKLCVQCLSTVCNRLVLHLMAPMNIYVSVNVKNWLFEWLKT